MSRRAWAVVDTAALRHNLQRVRACAPDSKVMAAVKADGYGHGAVQVSRVLADAGVDALAVATLDEAMQLRWSQIALPICLLGGVQNAEEAGIALEQGIQVVVHDFNQIQLLKSHAFGGMAKVWIKLDTGMHRLGFDPNSLAQLQAELADWPGVEILGWMTHLASADHLECAQTAQQLAVFSKTLMHQQGMRSIANSAAILFWSDAHVDWVRPGIMLYGSSPMSGDKPEHTAAALGLQPVMSLFAPVITIRDISAGESVGYSATWTAEQATRIAVVGIGYGDGYPRHLPNGTPVMIKGQRCSMVGRVSMDMITVELPAGLDIQVGDTAELWGQNIAVDEIARMAGTIAYELFCQLTSRVDFEYR